MHPPMARSHARDSVARLRGQGAMRADAGRLNGRTDGQMGGWVGGWADGRVIGLIINRFVGHHRRRLSEKNIQDAQSYSFSQMDCTPGFFLVTDGRFPLVDMVLQLPVSEACRVLPSAGA